MFDYIDSHPYAVLTVDELSRCSNFSRYHFQRLFSEYVGMGVTRYIQLIRMRQAS